MPNHVKNVFQFSGSKEVLDELAALLKGGEGDTFRELDFDKVIPSPVNMFRDNLGEEDRIRCKEQGIPIWYDWQIENWGTKWNSYSTRTLRKDESYVIAFSTAWDSPAPIVDKVFQLAEAMKFSVKYYYADEGGFFAGGRSYCADYPEDSDATFEKKDHDFIQAMWNLIDMF